MQLLRVVSTMSYHGSPYSGPGDEYDYEDDGYEDLDEYREQEEALPPPPVDDSDEGAFVYDRCQRTLFEWKCVKIVENLSLKCLYWSYSLAGLMFFVLRAVAMGGIRLGFAWRLPA